MYTCYFKHFILQTNLIIIIIKHSKISIIYGKNNNKKYTSKHRKLKEKIRGLKLNSLMTVTCDY